MRNVKNFFLPIMAIASLLFVGCQKDQSEFTLDSITDMTTISGNAYYSTGVDTVGTNYTYDVLKPAVGRKVFVEVDYSQYQSGAGQGKKIYETIIDENGHFSIQVPTKSTGIQAVLRLEEFTANYTEYLKMEGGKPVFKTSLYRYSKSKDLTQLKPGTYEFIDTESIQYDRTSVSMDGYNEKVTLTGSINLAIETGYRQGEFTKANQATVEFQIDYGEVDGNNSPIYYNFGTVTDENGIYSITIPAKSLKEGFKITNIKVANIGNTNFIHWTSPTESAPLFGAYQLQNTILNTTKTLSNIIEGYPYELGETYLFFTPYYNGNITGNTTPINWTDDLAGWAFGMQEFAGMEGVVTLSGSVETAIETAYGIGAYQKAIQAITISGLKDNTGASTTLTLATDADGKFSVQVPVQDPNSKNTGLSVSIDNTAVVTYTHYNKTSTEVLKDGSYSSYVTIKDPSADWTDLGVSYYKFTPASSNTPDTWNGNLAGWIRIQDYNLTTTITGNLMFPQETAYATGNHIGAKDEIAEITVTYPTGIGNTTFAAPVAEDGSFNIVIPIKEETDKFTTAFVTNQYSTNTFKHFTSYNSSEPTLLQGSYSNDVHAVTSGNWTSVGTYYYKFTPTSTPASWHANLAGWVKVVDNSNRLYNSSITASGTAFLAKETAFATGTYEAAAGKVVSISAHGKTFQGLIDNTGKFEVEIPLKNQGDVIPLNVSASTISVSNFFHYNKGGATTGQTLEGSYTAGTVIKKLGTNWNELGTIYYKFTPTNAPSTWHKDLAGWAYRDGYERTGTLTGSIMMPVETSFWNGNYQAGAYQIVTLQCNSFTLVGATDANGNFSISVPLQFDDDKPTATWTTSSISTAEAGYFTHYPTVGSNATQLLDGSYEVKTTVKKTNAEWNELGCRYYKFVPTTATRNWSENLPGWTVYGTNANKRYTISGSVEKAVEAIDANQRVAAWEADKNRLVTVQVNGTSYDVATKADGSFSFYTQSQELPETITLTVTPKDDTSSALQFTHYEDPNEVNAGEKIRGKFISADNIRNATVYKPVSGTTYTYGENDVPVSAKMLFTPDYTPTNWFSYDWNAILSE